MGMLALKRDVCTSKDVNDMHSRVKIRIPMEVLKKLVAEGIEPELDVKVYGVGINPTTKRGYANLAFGDSNKYYDIQRPERLQKLALKDK